MDLSKMDPMARKMSLHMDELNKAMKANDSASSRFHLNEISKYADFLQGDLTNEIRKSEETPEPEGINQYVAGVPVVKFNESGSSFDPAERSRVLKGTIIPARTNTAMRNVSGTFGRWTE